MKEYSLSGENKKRGGRCLQSVYIAVNHGYVPEIPGTNYNGKTACIKDFLNQLLRQITGKFSGFLLLIYYKLTNP